MNKAFGRRGTIFISCLISAAACFWQAFTNTWWHMFIARFFLGFGIGPKSATTPIFAAECAPPKLRGALVMVSCLISPSPLSSRLVILGMVNRLLTAFSNGKVRFKFPIDMLTVK